MLAGANTEVEAIRLRDQTIEVLQEGGFQLRKWTSNHPKLLEDIPHTNAIEPIHFINKGKHTYARHALENDYRYATIRHQSSHAN